MRVLQIINSLDTGGAEKLLLDTIPIYQQLGITVDLLVFQDNNTQFLESLRKLDCCKIFVINETSNKKSIYSVSNINKIKHFIANYDIAHVHLFPAQYFTVIAKLIAKSPIKLIFTEHNTSNRRINNKIFKPIEKYIYSKYTNVVCITEEIKSIFIKYLGLNASKFVLINNGVNIDLIKEAPIADLSKILSNYNAKNKYLLQVSAFRAQKDQKTLIRSLMHLPTNYQLLLVGDGTFKLECEALVKSLQLEDRVTFLGLRMDVPSIMKAADIMVLSSHYEGLSLASIEAMASGKPFVATDVPGIKELVEGYGVLFPLGDDKALANYIFELGTNPTMYQSVVEKCQTRAADFDIKKMVDKHIDLYKSVYNSK